MRGADYCGKSLYLCVHVLLCTVRKQLRPLSISESSRHVSVTAALEICQSESSIHAAAVILKTICVCGCKENALPSVYCIDICSLGRWVGR